MGDEAGLPAQAQARKGWACRSSSAEGARFARVVRTARPVAAEAARGLSASRRSHWREEGDKEGFKRKRTKSCHF